MNVGSLVIRFIACSTEILDRKNKIVSTDILIPYKMVMVREWDIIKTLCTFEEFKKKNKDL